MTTKVCVRCKIEQDIGAFYRVKLRKNAPYSYCRTCVQKERRDTNAKDPSIKAAISKACRLRNPKNAQYCRKQLLRRRWGLTPEEYNTQMKLQNNVCAICFKPQSDRQHLCIDHSHIDGFKRGLLCTRCNIKLATLEDRTIWFHNAQRYLQGGGIWGK